MVNETLVTVLYLDGNGFPVSQSEIPFSCENGSFAVTGILPHGTHCVRVELPAPGDVLVRVTSASAGGRDAEAVCQNASAVRDGDLFLSCRPRYMLCWEGQVSGLFSLSGTITHMTHGQTVDALVSAVESWKGISNAKDAEISRIQRALDDIHTSRAWRAVRVYYKIKDGIKSLLSLPKRAVRSGALLAYRLLPLPPGVKLRFKRYTLSRFNFLSSLTGKIRHTEARRKEAADGFCCGRRRQIPLPQPPDESPGTVAVHLHLHYIDLLDEFTACLNGMPYPFDLFVSVTDTSVRDTVYGAFAGCPNVRGVRVEVVPNRGRDVAPMLNVFGGILAGYDYFLHIHSKKSPHLKGAFDWRRYLIDNLAGSGERIARILGLFAQNPEVGIIYPEPHSDLPYWSLTTLNNEPELRRLFALIDLDYPDGEKYIDFPAGTMFWARGKALERLLRAGITEFPEEAGQLDGTLGHAVERCLCLVAEHAGFVPAQLQAGGAEVNIGAGLRNLDEYLATDSADMAKTLGYYKHVVFDLFGTLVCSRYADDTALWKAVEHSLGSPFADLREQAEQTAFAQAGAVDIHNVYMEFKRLSGLSSEECERIKALEFSVLLDSCLPRKAVTDIYNYMLSQRCGVVIADDTVWPRAYIDRILIACGITVPQDIYLSCENGLYKRGGRMYDFLAGRFGGQTFINAGDHELDDVQTPNDHRFAAFHVMHPRDMMRIAFLNEPYFERCCYDPFCLSEIFREQSGFTNIPVEPAVSIS